LLANIKEAKGKRRSWDLKRKGEAEAPQERERR